MANFAETRLIVIMTNREVLGEGASACGGDFIHFCKHLYPTFHRNSVQPKETYEKF